MISATPTPAGSSGVGSSSVDPSARASVGAGSLRSHRRTLAMLVATLATSIVLAVGPIAIGVWAARSWRRSDFLFVDLVFVVVVVSSVATWARVSRPRTRVKRIVVVPVVAQSAGRRVVERSAFGVGAMTTWTSVEPDHGLTLVEAPRVATETEWEDGRFARGAQDTDLLAAGVGAAARTSPAPVAARSVADDAAAHVTTRGESFWSLAQERLGDATRWTELRDLNVGREVAPGIVLSESDGLRAGYRILVPTETSINGRGANPA